MAQDEKYSVFSSKLVLYHQHWDPEESQWQGVTLGMMDCFYTGSTNITI